MEFKKKLGIVKEELMIYAMSSDLNKIKKVFYQNNNYLGREGLLLVDIFKYSYETMNIELLKTIYEINNKMDNSIKLENNPKIFYKSILFQNTSFYQTLLSYPGPLYVFNNNKQKIIDFTIKQRCRFIPVLDILSTEEINKYISLIIEDAIICYDENLMRKEEIEYRNGNYVYMDFEYEQDIEPYSEKIHKHIPLRVIDDQYIHFLRSLLNK